jgi:cytochrome c oxidase subunit 2
MMEKLLNLPVVASEHGRDVNHLMVLLHYLMAILVVGWSIYFVYVLFRFRGTRQKKANHSPIGGHTSTYLEIAVASVEILLLVGFAIPLWGRVADDFPPEDEAVVVRVVAEQFAWTFIYPGPDGKFGRQDLNLVRSDNPFGFDPEDPATADNVTSLNEMRAPLNKPVILNVSSKDVIHSFKVVPLRVTQDATPGLNVPVHFVATREGRYQVICAQLCGNGHAAMAQGVVVVEPEAAFQEWLASKGAAGDTATSFE